MAKKCSLCGGNLTDNKCEFCGMDNSVYDRDYMSNPYRIPPSDPDPKPARHTSVHKTRLHRTGQSTGSGPGSHASVQPKEIRKKFKGSNNSGQKLVVVIIVILILAVIFLPALIQLGSTWLESSPIPEDVSSWLDFSDDDYDDPYITDEYDPYVYATREIPETGDTYETVLGHGFYQVGVHIPEGVYHAELIEGSGILSILDEDNMIYDSVWFGPDEEWDEVTEQDGLRLYSGAQIEVYDKVLLKLTTANAQPYTKELTANPLTETITLDEGVYTVGEGELPEGIYDLYLRSDGDYTYTDIEITYPDGSNSYLTPDRDIYSEDPDYYTDKGIKNVILPAGTQVTLSGSPLDFRPGAGCYDIDYTSYSPEY